MDRSATLSGAEGRRAGGALLIALAAGTSFTLGSGAAMAGPRGERVVRGSAQVERNGAQTVIHAANKTIINFESFNVGAGETVQFVQPSAKARVLNRVKGEGPSQIDGALLANGRVYIVNPAGVVFGANSIVNAAGFVAAAGDLSDRDFVAGVNRFTNLTGTLTAQGLISADAVSLVGREVANAGTIVADGGIVTLVAGDDVMLREKGSSIMLRVDGRDLDPAQGPSAGTGTAAVKTVGVENSGSIRADHGSVTLGAGDAYSLAIRNSGRIDAPGGSVTLASHDGVVRNEGSLSASVRQGRAGSVTMQGVRVENAGAISADAQSGKAGSVEVTSSQGTTLSAGSSVTAGGGAGVAEGGKALVHAYGGDTSVERGATVDVSGGAQGGDGGFAEVSAGGRLAIDGALRGEALAGYEQASLLLDPLNIVIATPGAESGEVGDGLVLAGEGAGATWQITPGAIEGFSGNVRLEATQDIFVTESINKANGGLTFEAGRDISFSTDKGGLLPALSITAQFIDFTAGRNIVDRAITRTNLTSTVGNITLEATTGSIKTGRLAVPAGAGVMLTQAQSRLVGAGPTGNFANPETTNLTVNITDGFLIFGGDFGGVSGYGSLLSVDATASDFLRIEDDLTIGSFANFRSATDVQIDGFVHAGGPVAFHGATDGTGAGGGGSGVRFLSPGQSVWGSSISFRAGNGAGGGADIAQVDLVGNSPTFAGALGAATRPAQFTIRQDASLADANLPSAGQFGAPLAGMTYQLISDGGSVTVATPSKVNGSALTISGATGATIGGNLSLASLLVQSALDLGGDVNSIGDQTYQGGVSLSDDVSLQGGAILFANAVNSSGATPHSLTIDADGVTFGAGVGTTSALASMDIDAASALNGGQIRTVGDQRFAGPVTLGAHTQMRSLGDGVIRIDSTINGGYDLNILTGMDGLIVFAANVGGTEALRDLTLSTAGGGSRPVPKAATIVGENSLTFNVRDFTMGQNEKFTTLGALTINASRSATLGDLVTTQDMTVTAPQITLLLRPASELLDQDGTILEDSGLDFVSGGALTFNGAITLGGIAGSPDPTFGAVLGAGTGAAPAGFDLLAVDAADTTQAALTYQGRVLDQRTPAVEPPPEPPVTGDEDVSAALAGAEPEAPQVTIPIDPEAYDLSVLARIAVLGRPVTEGEAVSALSGRAIYVDLPASIQDFDQERTTAGTRIDPIAASRAARTFNTVFGLPGEERYQEVGGAIAGSLERYLSVEQAASADPATFRRYLNEKESEAETLALIRGLDQLMGQLRGLGLTEIEYQEAQRRILSAIVTPGGPSVETLAQILEARPETRAQATGEGIASPRG